MTDAPGGHWVPLDEASNIRGDAQVAPGIGHGNVNTNLI